MEKLKLPGIFDECRDAGGRLEKMVQTFQQSAEYYTLIENKLIDNDPEKAHFAIILHICMAFADGKPVVCHLWDEKNKKFVKKELYGGYNK